MDAGRNLLAGNKPTPPCSMPSLSVSMNVPGPHTPLGAAYNPTKRCCPKPNCTASISALTQTRSDSTQQCWKDPTPLLTASQDLLLHLPMAKPQCKKPPQRIFPLLFNPIFLPSSLFAPLGGLIPTPQRSNAINGDTGSSLLPLQHPEQPGTNAT